MCGLLFSNFPFVNEQHFIRALELLKHRGPDAPDNYLRINNSYLGHARLKILDLDNRSNQPFYSKCRRYIIIFNGEIYNFKELLKKYKIKQNTSSDTELLIELYSVIGESMLAELNGMFAFVIYDTETNQIFAARDRLGIKPLYMYRNKDLVSFSSEISPILELHGISDFDKVGIRQYKKLRTFFNGRTLYSGVELFPAGHYLKDGKLVCYWRLPEGEQAPPSDDELYELINSAVNYRCLSDVPVGSYLSGGIDSTIVAGLANKPYTWTVGFEILNEFEWARLASESIGSNHTEVIIDNDTFRRTLKWMVNKRKEPLSVPNEVLLYLMTKEVKKKNTVVLSGEGADELFFGYDRIFKWANENKWDIKEFTSLYAYGSHEDYEIVEEALSPFLHLGNSLDIVAAFFQIAHLHGLLRRLDNSTMLCSVEARVPFVDHRLVERMSGVDFKYRMAGGNIKDPLKRVFKDILPDAIIKRKKMGFPVPLDNIFMESAANKAGMDNWLDYNLSLLGIVNT